MNQKPLLTLQAELDEVIKTNHPPLEGEDRLAKKILALIAEIMELANETRCFKFWSEDQEARVGGEVECENCEREGYGVLSGLGTEFEIRYSCNSCKGTGFIETPNRVLEELTDCFAFFFSIVNDLNMGDELSEMSAGVEGSDLVFLFNKILDTINHLNTNYGGCSVFPQVCIIYSQLLHLGEQLGFTHEQLEQAYIAKTKINHERQENGY